MVQPGLRESGSQRSSVSGEPRRSAEASAAISFRIDEALRTTHLRFEVQLEDVRRQLSRRLPSPRGASRLESGTRLQRLRRRALRYACAPVESDPRVASWGRDAAALPGNSRGPHDRLLLGVSKLDAELLSG